MTLEHTFTVVVLGATITGFVFGFCVQSSRFCLLGAISDLLIYKSVVRAKMWLIALLSAIATTQILILNNYIYSESSVFLNHQVIWFSNIFGGLCFGIGMALASGCASRALIRLGEGNLKALVVLLVIAVSALVTLKGLFASPRINFFEKINFSISQQKGDLVTFVSSILSNEDTIREIVIFTVFFFLVLILFFNIFDEKNFKTRSKKNYFLSLVLGILITCGWMLTGNIGFIAEHPDTLEISHIATNSNSIESFSFVGPIAYLAELLMFWSDNSKKFTFGITIVLGTFFGSLFSAIRQKTFRLEGFTSASDFYYHIIGGVLMGVGGVIAVGCSIGHGLSGMSFLSISSIITSASILVGAYFGLLYIQNQT